MALCKVSNNNKKKVFSDFSLHIVFGKPAENAIKSLEACLGQKERDF